MTKVLSTMLESETIDYLSESLKQASDIARQLRKLQDKEKWNEFADLLNRIHHKCAMLATARSLNRTDTLFLLDRENKKLNGTTLN